MRIETSLNDMLERANELPWNHHLYAPKEEALRLDSPVIVLNDGEEIERGESDEPVFTESRSMEYVLGIAAVQDIVGNLQRQTSNPSLQEKYQALLYYLSNDAFIRITSTANKRMQSDIQKATPFVCR